MSNVVQLCSGAPVTTVAKVRLDGIWSEVDAHVSRLKLERLTASEMNRILRILDTANECIRIVLSDFDGDPAFDQSIRRSREIKAMIEAARKQVAGLPAEARSA